MKSDLDSLMAERGLDALIIFPSERENPFRTYLANGADFSGMVVKKCGAAPLLFANSMELDEARRSGLEVRDYEAYGYSDLLREHMNDLDIVRPHWYGRIFEQHDVRGRVGVLGVADVNDMLRLIRLLERALADRVEFVTEPARRTLFDAAVETKDPDELARLRDVGRRTSGVMRATRDWLATARQRDGAIIGAAGEPLTIGNVKRFVRRQLFDQGLEDPEGMIFAQGRDGALPHSKGEDGDALRAGAAIVFDLFPREPRGYFHDVTRTWCLGHAAPEVQAAYDAVMAAFQRGAALCQPGASTTDIQQAVCQLFEARGHSSVLNTPGTARGYTHSLAHGVGLNVHEAPYFPTFGHEYRLRSGSVFTIEPGLYYPEEGFGVRIEDTVFLNEAGRLETLTECPYDLVIELDA